MSEVGGAWNRNAVAKEHTHTRERYAYVACEMRHSTLNVEPTAQSKLYLGKFATMLSQSEN